MNFAKNVADQIIFMENGVIVSQGTPEEVFDAGNARLQEFLGRYEAD
jgi:ABC-type polar amino acid transport system ATPase subunit